MKSVLLHGLMSQWSLRACVCVSVCALVCVCECLCVDTLKRDYVEETQGNRIDDENMTFQGVFGANRFLRNTHKM